MEFSFKRGRFIALSPKTYYAFDEENNEVKSAHKGVPNVEARKLQLDEFVECLYNNTEVHVISRELRRNKNQQMIYKETSKRGLNPIFKKFRVQDDRISCLPLCKNGKVL